MCKRPLTVKATSSENAPSPSRMPITTGVPTKLHLHCTAFHTAVENLNTGVWEVTSSLRCTTKGYKRERPAVDSLPSGRRSSNSPMSGPSGTPHLNGHNVVPPAEHHAYACGPLKDLGPEGSESSSDEHSHSKVLVEIPYVVHGDAVEMAE